MNKLSVQNGDCVLIGAALQNAAAAHSAGPTNCVASHSIWLHGLSNELESPAFLRMYPNAVFCAFSVLTVADFIRRARDPIDILVVIQSHDLFLCSRTDCSCRCGCDAMHTGLGTHRCFFIHGAAMRFDSKAVYFAQFSESPCSEQPWCLFFSILESMCITKIIEKI